MRADRPNRVPEIKAALTDVRAVCDALGLTAQGGKTVKRQPGGGLIVRCAYHQENTPSMSVRLAADGTIAVRCFGCDRGDDVLGLIAEVRGLNTKTQFREVLIEAARLAGLWGIVDEIEGRGARHADQAPPPPVATPPARPEPVRDYPPADEVETLWGAAGPVSDDADVSAYLRGRAIDPDVVAARDLARALPLKGMLPRWASYRGEAPFAESWRALGYRIVIPVFEASGAMRSVRAWRVVDGRGPKRLPPAGHKASGLVMADQWAIAMLRGARRPDRVVIPEGESDFLTWATRTKDPRTANVGIVSGAWTPELAARFPVGCRVDVRTDHDEAGDRYAAEVVMGLKRQCFVFRSREGT